MVEHGRRRGVRILQCIGGAAVLIGLAIPPSRLATRLTPADAQHYVTALTSGLWCSKAALLVMGGMLLAWRLFVRLWGTAITDRKWPRPVVVGAVSGWNTHDTVWSVVLLLLALFLRAVNLGQSLIADEVAIQQMFIDRGLPVILTYMPSMPHHVLYSVMVYFAELLPLPLEVAYRLPAVLFGAAAVPLTYVLVRRIFARPEALVVSLLMALSLFGVMHAQMGKSYVVTQFMVLVCIFVAYRIREHWQHPAGWLALGGCLVVLVYLHLYNVYLAAGVVLAFALVCVRCCGRRWDLLFAAARRLMVIGVFAGACLFLLYSVMLPQVVALAHEVGVQPEERLGTAFFRGLLMQATFWGGAWPLALFCAALASVGAVSLFVREPNAAILAFVPPAFMLLVVAANNSFVYPRYFLFVLPAFFVSCVEGASCAGRLMRSRFVAAAGAVAFALVFVVPAARALGRYYDVGHQNLRAAARFAEDFAGDDDTILSFGLCRDEFPFYAPRARMAFSVDDIDSALDETSGRVLILVAYPRVVGNREEEAAYLQDAFILLAHFPGMLMDSTQQDGDVLVFGDRASASQ